MRSAEQKRIIFGSLFLILSLFSFTASFLFIYFHLDIWLIIVMFISSFILLGLGFLLLSKVPIKISNNTGHIHKKPKKIKSKKPKRPFISKKGWNAQEEEDDEMFFIEEHVEDD